MGRPRGRPKLCKRNGIFYVRASVPRELWKALGELEGKSGQLRREIWRSLRTRDQTEANRKYIQESAKLENYFARWMDTRNFHPLPIHELTKSQISDISLHLYSKIIGKEDDRTKSIWSMSREEVENEIRGREDVLDLLDSGRATGNDDYKIAENQTDAILEDLNIMGGKDSKNYKQLRYYIYNALVYIQRRAIAIARGEDVPRNPQFVDTQSGEPKSVDIREVLTRGIPKTKRIDDVQNLTKQYIADRTRGKGREISAKTKTLDGGRLRIIFELLGDGVDLSEISHEDLLILREKLQRLPSNLRKRTNQPALEVISVLPDSEIKVISKRTVNFYLSTLNGFMRWCQSKRKIDSIPSFRNVLLFDQRHDTQRRDRFATEDLVLFFRSAAFTNWEGTSSWRFWGPLLGVYQGMRLGEICQLNAEDVFQTEGVVCIEITEAVNEGPSDKRVKSKNSHRVIPVHPILNELGFWEMASARPKTMKLFEDAKLGADGHYSSVASKAFKRMLKEAGLEEVKATFHSFRHNFASAMDQVEIPETVQDTLGGWATTTVSDRRTYRKRRSIPDLYTYVEMINFGDIDDVLRSMKRFEAQSI